MFFDWWTPIKNLPALLQGALLSLELTALVFFLSLLLGTLVGYIRYARSNKILYAIATVYVEVIRNTPVLVQLFFIYFGLPQFGIYLDKMVAGVIGLTVNNAAYIAETIRGGIMAVPKGQWEAARCIALKPIRVFTDVIFPQTLRNVFPALINQVIMVFFGTSLLSALDVRDLTQVASILNSRTFRTFELFSVAILIYFVISQLIQIILRYVNKKFFPSVNVR